MQVGNKVRLRIPTLFWANQSIQILDPAVSGAGIPQGASGTIVEIDTINNRILLELSWNPSNVRGMDERVSIWVKREIIGSFEIINS